jgi:serine/threonine protein kinase
VVRLSLQRPQDIQSSFELKRNSQNWLFPLILSTDRSGLWNGEKNLLHTNDTSNRDCLVLLVMSCFNFRYRAPEILFGAREYTTAIDIWSAGLILGELLLCTPILPGENEIQQVQLIIALLGCPPTEDIWTQFRNMPLRDEYKLPAASEALEKGKMTIDMRFQENSQATRSLMKRCLAWDPTLRYSARSALQHVYFKEDPRGLR